MDAKEFVALLGRTADSPEVKKVLAEYGVTKALRVKRGELYEYVQLKKQGLVFAFEQSDDPKSSRIALVDVQIFSSAEKGFSTYEADLPDGLKFTDTRSETRKRLGKPSESDATEDTWERKGYNLIVQYRKDTGQIQMLHLGLPVE